MADKWRELLEPTITSRLTGQPMLSNWQEHLRREMRDWRSAELSMLGMLVCFVSSLGLALWFGASDGLPVLICLAAGAIAGWLTVMAVGDMVHAWSKSHESWFNRIYHQRVAEYKEQIRRLHQDAEACRNELESRGKGFLSRYADLLESEHFRCELNSDEVWEAMRQSFRGRGHFIPMKTYVALFNSLQTCRMELEALEPEPEVVAIMERAKALCELRSRCNNGFDEAVECSVRVFQEWQAGAKSPRLACWMDELSDALATWDAAEKGYWIEAVQYKLVELMRQLVPACRANQQEKVGELKAQLWRYGTELCEGPEHFSRLYGASV